MLFCDGNLPFLMQNSSYNNGNPAVGKFSHGNLDNTKVLGCSGGPVGGGPLYSNLGDYPPYILDPEVHAHLLPLQQYILEQAKLSGNQMIPIIHCMNCPISVACNMHQLLRLCAEVYHCQFQSFLLDTVLGEFHQSPTFSHPDFI